MIKILNVLTRIFALILISLLVLALNRVDAQVVTEEFTSSALKAMGAPNDPQVEIAWNRYYDWQEIGEICQRLEKAFPELLDYGSIGRSVEGKTIHLLTVSNKKTGDPDGKPAMYIDGNIHSNEIQGAEVALYTAWYLVENYGRVDWITELVDTKTFYIVPTINPDARDYFIHEGNNPHSPRSGMKPRDDDGDGVLDEDGYDDLDNDGHIVMMRIKDPNGRYKIDPDYPQMMVRAEADEKGAYRLLGWEGYDNDGDGRVNEDGPGYYDPNRNWGWGWRPSYLQYGSDHYPFSIPENRAVADFVMNHPNIGGAQSYHNTGGMILRGPGSAQDDTTYGRADVAVYDFLGELGEEMIPGYNYLVLHKDLYEAHGGELDWFYGARGIYTFTNELWASFDYFKAETEGGWFGNQELTHRFNQLLLFGEGIIEWQEIEHPQYGAIEIGGIKKSWSRTAPSFMIEDMCHRNMAFTLFHAYHLPVLSIDSVEISDLPGGLQQVDVIIRNDRVIPTRSNHEVRHNITPPDVVSIQGNRIDVIAGFHVTDPLLNLADEQRYQPSHLKVESIDGMDITRLRWIVSGRGDYTIRVDSNKGGILEESFQL